MAEQESVKLTLECPFYRSASLRCTKTCRVCGDHATGYNFNVITCESCKAFFRRNALRPKVRPGSDCEINAVSRRFCQKCRLRKLALLTPNRVLLKRGSVFSIHRAHVAQLTSCASQTYDRFDSISSHTNLNAASWYVLGTQSYTVVMPRRQGMRGASQKRIDYLTDLSFLSQSV
ncbi:unnamed protein product [Heligmosomoides polygyrus]|uniref:Nuclear receptor domain-containing protein n=1 Tax=Heligmosomoides polygyrus TaxID=6339 RepID=A0A183FR55_HELPZ|nr:unnamed protein product [Heligmosomoides polygyrus]